MAGVDDEVALRLRRRAARHGGAITREQVLVSGLPVGRLRGLVRRGAWQRVHPGVYVTFSGPLPWRTRAWAALLYAGEGAVLALDAAAFEIGMQRRPPAVVDLWVPAHRSVRSQPGVRVHRRRGLPRDGVRMDPPRTRVEPTVLDLVARRRSPDDVVGVVTEGVRRGASVAELRSLLVERPTHPWRRLLTDVLADCEEGVESPLERRYHHDVERRHALPRSELQVRQRLPHGSIRSDRRVRAHRLRVELDGSLGHPGGRTDEDTWRDDEVLVASDETTLRYRWSHVAGDPCRTAAQVVRALRRRGWTGAPRTCGPDCAAGS